MNIERGLNIIREKANVNKNDDISIIRFFLFESMGR